ncbi:hypothetical protein HPC49_26060, partial [Pyxidicoccus fallax]
MADTNLSRALSVLAEDPASSPSGNGLRPLCEFGGLRVYALQLSEHPALVQHITRLRASVFGEGGAWNYGLDDQDAWAIQLVAFEEDAPVGALRLCMGDELMGRQGLSAFYLNTGWVLDARAASFFGTALEYGRFWALRGHPRSQTITNALLSALGAYARQRPAYQHVFGTVSLLGFEAAHLGLVVDYLRRHHLPAEHWIHPRRPFQA